MYPYWRLFLGFCLCQYWYACAQSTAEEKVEKDNDVILTCDLTGTFTQPKWEDPDKIVTFVGIGTDVFNIGESRTSRMTRVGTDKRNINFVNLVATDTGRYMCSSTGLGTHTITLTVFQSAQLGEACSTSPLIQCVAANSTCTNDVCVCEDGFTQSNNVCVCDCCCCDNKPKRDGACGAVLGVCICVMAVLVICFYKGFSSKHLEGKIFKLILAIFCLIVALTGLILSAICLSKECCSCSGDSCQAKNCFKGDTIAGFVMTGLSVLGTVIVIILIFLITGESGSGKKKTEAENENVGLKAN